MKDLLKKIRNRLLFYYDRRKYFNIIKEASNFLSSKGVNLVFFLLPNRNSIQNLTSFERERLDHWVFDYNHITKDESKLKKIYGENVDLAYISSLYDGGVVVKRKGYHVLVDFSNENVHIINGKRLTTDRPNNYKRKIHICGACTVRGIGVSDNQTIASYMQRMINERYPDTFLVVNDGIGRGTTIVDDYHSIRETSFKEGDVVIWCPWGRHFHGAFIKLCNSLGIPVFTTSALFNRPNNIGEWFTDDTLHTNNKGNEILADYFFNKIEEKGWLELNNLEDKKEKYVFDNKDSLLKGEKIYGDNPELQRFIDGLVSIKKEGYNGAIVMNCNPFTLGHLYLIEYAASRVDNLYIFVVEENKSFFSFEDRLDLVKKGTSHLKNVLVLPSGKFIISAVTFPGYFYKNYLKDATIDASNDLEVFGNYIAPSLNIKVRFAGEEPLDPVTCQYNDSMAEMLPKYGINFISIPRREDNNGVISASRVRSYIKSKKFEEIKKIVPDTTYNYIIKKFHD